MQQQLCLSIQDLDQDRTKAQLWIGRSWMEMSALAKVFSTIGREGGVSSSYSGIVLFLKV